MNKEFWNKKWLGKYVILYKNADSRVVFKVLDVFKESYYKPVRLRIEPLNNNQNLWYNYPVIVDANKVRHATAEEIATVIGGMLNPNPVLSIDIESYSMSHWQSYPAQFIDHYNILIDDRKKK